MAASQARFCNMCGTTLTELTGVALAPAAGSPPEPAAPAPDHAERRQLTVLFADVVGATVLSGQLDPEELRALLRAYQTVCVQSIARYGGTIHQYAGDGVLAYFGFPTAHDNDAERAVLAALGIVEGVRKLADERRGRGQAAFAARVGIHTGLVVMGEMGAGESREIHAIGETPNIAARVQGEATPDRICISAATMRLAGPRLLTRSLGLRALKGVARDIELFEIEGLSLVDGHGQVPRAAAPLVGRTSELSLLLERWELARQGQGQAVLVSGEGGIGKSRLLDAFREQVNLPVHAWRNIFCSPFLQNSTLQPMIDLIERALDRNAGTGASRAARLRDLMQASDMLDDTAYALMAALVGLDPEGGPSLRELAPDQRKRRTMDTLIAWLHADAQRQPLVVVVEDLHWVDASTRDMLGVLLERIASVPILAIFTFRPEFVPTWTLHGQISMITLTRMTPQQIDAVTRNVTGGRPLPPGILQEIVQRTDGVPLFVEELTKSIIASGLVEERDGALQVAPGRAASLEIPTTLRDSLTARLDRLGPAKLLAQQASVLGREFDHAVLQAVSDLPAADLEARLSDLNRAEIIHQRGVPPRAHYIFKHALIQEAAYDTLLIATRQTHHLRIAQTYEKQFPEVTKLRPELIAHHYSRAARPAEALAHWQRAGELAVARSGYIEAIAHLGAALEQLQLLPDGAERAATELALRVKIGPAVVAAKGMHAAESGANYARACELAESLGDRPERFMAMWGDWLYTTTTGNLDAAIQRSEQLVALGRRLGDDGFRLQAHHARWTSLYTVGDARTSRADTLEGIRLYDRERHGDHKHLYGGHDPGVCACGVGANVAWQMGYRREGLKLAETAITTATSLEHPFSLSLAFLWSTQVFHFEDDHARALRGADDFFALSDKHGFRQWMGIAAIMSGHAQVMQGVTSFGLKRVEDGMAIQRTNGPQNFLPIIASAAASAHLRVGNLGRAVDLINEGVELARRVRIASYLPELERLRANILLQAGVISRPEAIRDLMAAAKLAHEQAAYRLQWRVKLSLAELLRDHGQVDEARMHLLSIGKDAEGDADLPEILEARQRLLAL